jgi:hypothetical protein
VQVFKNIFPKSGRVLSTGYVTRIFDVGIDGVYYEIEEGFETGITIAFGGLFGSVSKFGQKGKDLFWGDGIYPSVTKFSLELIEDKLIILHRIFF